MLESKKKYRIRCKITPAYEERKITMRENVIVFDHPLIQHKISLIRSRECGTREFRTVVGEIAMLMGYEVMRDLETEPVKIETPMEVMEGPMLKGKKLAVIPILRAGLGMVDGILSLVPSAKVGHVGMYRDEETLEPKEYYCKLPEDIDQRTALIVDPMLATGGSADAAVEFVKKKGAKNIKFVSIIAAPEGVERLAQNHPDIQIYCGVIDRGLNEQGYILPGLGDAGDRIFGTK